MSQPEGQAMPEPADLSEEARLDSKELDRARAISFAAPGEEPERYVPAAAYLEQRRRAERLNRTLHVVAGHVFRDLGHGHPAARLLLAEGIDPAVVAAVFAIIEQVRDGSLAAAAAGWD